MIGGGAAGLSAAWRLRAGGAAVTLHEASERVGGLLRTETIGGCQADIGAQLLGGYYTETRALLAAADCDGLLVRAPGRDALWRGGRAHEIAYGSPASMLASGALPFLLKARLGSSYLPFLLSASELSANEPVRAARHDDESIAAWGARTIGPDFVELFAYPLLASYYGATPEQTSAGFYHSLGRAGVGVELLSARGGMRALAGCIAAALERNGVEIRTGVDVSAVHMHGDTVRIAHGSSQETEYDAVLLAVPPRQVTRLTELPALAAAWMKGVRSRSGLVVAIAVRRPLPHRWFGLSFPRSTGPGAVVAAVCQQSQKNAALDSRDGGDVLVVVPAPAQVHAFMRASDDDVSAKMLPALLSALPEMRGNVADSRVFRFEDAGAEFYPGYLRHLARFDPHALPARMELAGAYLVAPTVEGAVRSGAAAAERLMEKLGVQAA